MIKKLTALWLARYQYLVVYGTKRIIYNHQRLILHLIACDIRDCVGPCDWQVFYRYYPLSTTHRDELTWLSNSSRILILITCEMYYSLGTPWYMHLRTSIWTKYDMYSAFLLATLFWEACTQRRNKPTAEYSHIFMKIGTFWCVMCHIFPVLSEYTEYVSRKYQSCI